MAISQIKSLTSHQVTANPTFSAALESHKNGRNGAMDTGQRITRVGLTDVWNG